MSQVTGELVDQLCEDCGKIFQRLKGRTKKRCFECGIAVLKDTQDQMHAKEGPHYEAIVKKQLRTWRSEAKRLGIRA